MSYSRLFKLVFKIIFIIGLCVFGIHYWVCHKTYTFSAEDIEKITLKHFVLGKNVTTTFEDIYEELHSTYPGHILGAEHRKWVFMNCGGWMGAAHIIHASLTEYVLFFGTGVDTSGNSGRYWANISDTIINGTFRQWQEGDLHSKHFYPGDTVYHYLGEAAAVQWSAGTWMVEYGRGFIPSTLGFALADTIFSTQDFFTLFYILRVYAHALIMEMDTFISELVLS